MLKNSLKILWVCLLFSLALGYSFLLRDYANSKYYFYPFLILLVLGAVSWLFITVRVIIFKSQLVKLFRHLLEGDYEVGIKAGFFLRDEINLLVKLINKTVDQLRTYDQLRAERVAFSYRAIEHISRSVKEGIIIADIEKGVFQFNPAAQAVFNVGHENITFDSIYKQEENKEFSRIFKNVIEWEKVPKEAKLTLQLPIRQSRKELVMKIIPLKDKNERVKLVIIFINNIS